MTSDELPSFSVKCPICKKRVEWNENPARPFCSERCRLIDLGSWASGEYRVPLAESPDMNEEE